MKIILTAILALLIFSGCSDEKDLKTTQNIEKKVKQKTEIAIPEKVDDSIVLVDTNGNSIKVTVLENGLKFEGYEDKIVLLNFFATWCPPCKAEIPHLNNLQEKYKKDIKIISVLLEENRSNTEINDFIKKNAIEFTITNSQSNFDIEKEIGGVKTIPFMLIYDRKGNYSQHYMGAVPEEMIDADIQKVL